MSARLTYFSPTTPGASSFTEDITSAIRLGEITGLAAEARVGATGTSGQVFDDPDATLGHASDGIVGLKQAFLDETTAPVGNQRVWTGYTGERTYRRGDDSLRLGVSRKVDLTLIELDNFLDFRVFAPVADDPTSSFDRPAESTIERIQALLTAVDFLSTTLFDIGYIPTTGDLPMDAHDYTGSHPSDVLNDIAQVSGWNFFLLYDETDNQVVLWMDIWTTDGTATLVYDSALLLTNVNSERASDTFAIAPGATEVRDPSRVIAGVWVMGKGQNVYRTRPETAWTFGWRDAVYEAQYLSDPVKLAALGDRYLLDNSTEEVTINCSVQLPAALVTGIHKGQRIQLHATHLSSVAAGFTWCRIMSLTVRQDQQTEEFYWLDLVLSPILATECSFVQYTGESDSSLDIFGASIGTTGAYQMGPRYDDIVFWWNGNFTPGGTGDGWPNRVTWWGFDSGVTGPGPVLEATWTWDLNALGNPSICTVMMRSSDEGELIQTLEASNDGTTWDTIVDFGWASLVPYSSPPTFWTYRYWRLRVYYEHPGGFFPGIENEFVMLSPAL